MEYVESTSGGRAAWRAWLICSCVFVCALSSLGCGDDDSDPEQQGVGIRPQHGDGGVEPDAGAVSGECGKKDDGKSCGSGKLCMKQRCVLNVCGDGVVAGSEACDDGNQRTGDGCDPACRVEGEGCGDGTLDDGEECDDGNWIDVDSCSNDCTINECGNARIDLLEECDDGNTIDDDSCSNTCMVVQCRNGRLDPGEECDDGNTINTDHCTNGCRSVDCGNGKVEGWEFCDDGNTVDDDECPNNCLQGSVCGDGIVEGAEQCEGSHQGFPESGDRANPMCSTFGGMPATIPKNEEMSWSCSADCKARLPYDDCESCRDEWCRDVNGVDMVKGCFEQLNSDFGIGMVDECALQQCADAVNCGVINHCSLDSSRDDAACYCGNSRDNVMCQGMGPATDAPCVGEWQNAARTTDNSLLFGRFADLSFPVGFAHYLLKCYSAHCSHECMDAPECTTSADCSDGKVCCGIGTTDDDRYHNFKCVDGSKCEGVVNDDGVSGHLRVACGQSSECPQLHPNCKDKRDAAREMVAPLVLTAGKKVCDDMP